MAQHRVSAAYRTAEGEVDTARLKSEISIVEVAAMVTKLTKAGAEWKGLCPIHHENQPSFHVNEAKGVFYCHGCRAGGDVIALVQAIGGRSFIESVEWLVGSEWTCPAPIRESAIEASEKRQRNLEHAKAEWRKARSITGTVAERYLARRGIVGAVPGCIRFGNVPRWWGADGAEGHRFPAMIAACQDLDGVVVGVQRTFLDRHGRKIGWSEPRLSLGQIRGGALRLGPTRPEIMLATAVEDALSLTRMFPGATVWSAFGDANLAHVALPDIVRRVVLCGDADEPGRAAVAEARAAFEAKRIEVVELFPHGGAKDFNQEWLMLRA